MTDQIDTSPEAIAAILENVTPGRAVQFHPTYCPEAKDAPMHEWDTSHDISVIRADGSRYRIANFRHASEAAFHCAARGLVPALAARLAEVEAERDAAICRANDQEDCADRYRYVLEGVKSAIDTGRNEPLQVWRDQIVIALDDDAHARAKHKGEPA